MTDHLEKDIWSDADFDRMGWHDATIHAFTPFPDDWELAFDIDYIVKWVDPEPPSPYFSFWVAPATLVFRDVSDIEIAIALPSIERLTIDDLSRSDPRETGASTDWQWTLRLHQGPIGLRA